MALALSAAAAVAVVTFWTAMQRGIRALERMGAEIRGAARGDDVNKDTSRG